MMPTIRQLEKRSFFKSPYLEQNSTMIRFRTFVLYPPDFLKEVRVAELAPLYVRWNVKQMKQSTEELLATCPAGSSVICYDVKTRKKYHFGSSLCLNERQ
jgi:hypothetical protein